MTSNPCTVKLYATLNFGKEYKNRHLRWSGKVGITAITVETTGVGFSVVFWTEEEEEVVVEAIEVGVVAIEYGWGVVVIFSGPEWKSSKHQTLSAKTTAKDNRSHWYFKTW